MRFCYNSSHVTKDEYADILFVYICAMGKQKLQFQNTEMGSRDVQFQIRWYLAEFLTTWMRVIFFLAFMWMLTSHQLEYDNEVSWKYSSNSPNTSLCRILNKLSIYKLQYENTTFWWIETTFHMLRMPFQPEDYTVLARACLLYTSRCV